MDWLGWNLFNYCDCRCGAFIQFDEAPDTADSPYFLYSNKVEKIR